MSGGRRGSEWLSIRRGLALLQRLMRGPASKPELVEFVRGALGPEAYPAQADHAFKRDRTNLKQHFGVEFEYEHASGEYRLIHPGRLFLLELSDQHLAALKLLWQTFEDGVGEVSRVRALLDELTRRLPEDRRRALERLPARLEVELEPLDEGEIPVRVWELVNRAVNEHRQLAFHHYSPRRPEGELMRYVVAAYRVCFRRGHWYLHAIGLQWGKPGEPAERGSDPLQFRLRYIQDDAALEVLPMRVPPEQRRPHVISSTTCWPRRWGAATSAAASSR